MKAVIFDAYGTLLDVHCAMERYAPRLGPDWQAISRTWRSKQIEYTWVWTLAGERRDFAALTRDALHFAAAKHGVTDAGLLAEVEQAYRQLDAYPDAGPVLEALRQRGVPRAVLSNGERTMLDEGVRHAGLAGLVDDVISADAAGVFKPDRRVYQLAVERFGCAAGEMAFVSSNPWDAFGAALFGFRVFWCNRDGQPEEYGLESRATVVSGLGELPELVGA